MSDLRNAALQARDLYRFYRAGDEETLALKGVSADIGFGEIVAVVGPSGSGKSTLLNCLAGLDEPAGGTVWVDGERMTNRSESERADLRARRMGVLFQTNNLLDHLTIEDNIRLTQSLVKRQGQRPLQLLEQVGVAHRRTAYPAQLSGGELARAALAVAWANEPAVLLADEPTGELDGETEHRLLALMRERADSGHGVLVVTHSTEVMAIADRVIPLSDGCVST